jgi:hypothetical protein
MEIPGYLKGEVHLPLTEGMLSTEALPLANTFYQSNLQADDFKTTQAFSDDSGQLVLELICKESNDVMVTFVNKATGAAVAVVDADAGLFNLFNPLDQERNYVDWMAKPVQLSSPEEFAFLDELGSGNTYPTEATDNTLAFKLSRLLNHYQVAGQWMSGTMGELCTGGFELVFKGHSLDIPDGYLVDFSPELAIIQILHGKQKGYLCLRT